MKAPLPIGRALLATGLLLAYSAAAHAAGGYVIRAAQESMISPGMSMSEVQAKLGEPSSRNRYGSLPGPSWSYGVSDARMDRTVFDVDFGADGRVMSSEERILPMPLNAGGHPNTAGSM